MGFPKVRNTVFRVPIIRIIVIILGSILGSLILGTTIYLPEPIM